MDGKQTRESVSVVAVRDARPEGIETFLLKDPGSTRYGFPRTDVQDVDTTPRVANRCHGITQAMARKYLDHRKPFHKCLGYWVAASRELFVRTGVLSCTLGPSHMPLLPERWLRLVAQRSLLEQHELDLATLLEAENLFCDLKFLVPFAKWLDCPDNGSDPTQIFLARFLEMGHMSSGSFYDPRGAWLEPETAMIQWQQGHISFDFMTFGCLRTLTDFPDTASICAEYRLAG